MVKKITKKKKKKISLKKFNENDIKHELLDRYDAGIFIGWDKEKQNINHMAKGTSFIILGLMQETSINITRPRSPKEIKKIIEEIEKDKKKK